MKRAFVVASALSVLLIARSASAVTYIVPTDRDLVKRADGIVVATAIESHAQLNAFGGIVTVATFAVDEVIKGGIDSTGHLELVEAGGTIGDTSTVIPGSPRYANGKTYLIFLRHDSLGNWATWGFGLGKFAFEGDTLTRGGATDSLFGVEERDWSPHVERIRQNDRFLAFVRLVSANHLVPASDDYYAASTLSASYAAPVPKLPTNNQFHIAANGMTLYGLDAVAGLNAATASWTGVAGGNIHYSTGSLNFSATGGLEGLGSGLHDGHNAVLFNDPDVPPGAAAVGGISRATNTGYACGSATCFPIVEVDVVVGTGFPVISQAVFNGLVTHEIGHTLGLRHSDGTSNPLSPQNDGGCVINGTTCTHTAVMNSSVGPSNSTMQTYDNNAAVGVYGGGTATTYLWNVNYRWNPSATATFDYCSLPFVTSQPQASPTSISSGNSSQLTVVVSGADPLTYQWYQGDPPSTVAPIGTNAASIMVSPTSTTNYWVRASNSCGSPVNSNAVTLTVTGPCTPPGISAQPTASPTTIASGNSSQLRVSATGSATLTYQWYIGNTGDTSSPVGGATTSTPTVSPASTTTYWARVSNGCGSIDSNTVTVTVTVGCTSPSINQQPLAQPATISTGQSSQLSVIGAGTATLTYQWYIGLTGNTTTQAPSGNAAIIMVSPASTTTYWVRITNGCGTIDSNPVTVTISNGCAPPNVLAQPGDQTVTPGTVTLFVGYTGTVGTVIWYQGTAPDTSHSVGSGQSLQIAVTSTTQFWAQVVNSCGSSNSRTATITVTQACVAPGVTAAAANPTSVAPSAASQLTVTATGTSLTYQWYRGNAGDTANPIGGATASTTAVNPAATTSYWVRVTNDCGHADSITITVTVSTQCAAPTISTQPLSSTITSGQHLTLSVIASGGTLTYQWYWGAVDDTSTPLGISSSTLDIGPTFTTSFWVKVTNSCGNTKSNAAVITVNPAKHRAVRH